MLEKVVHGDEAVMAGLRPEVVRRKHRNRSQHAETTGAQPNPASDDDQHGAAKFNDDGCYSPHPGGLKPEMRLLRDSAGELDKLLDPSDQESRDQRDPRDRQQPWPRKDRRYPPRVVRLRIHLKPPSRRNRARPRSS